MRVQSVNLNLIPTGVMPIVHLSQYDRDADGALLFNIFNGPAPFNLTGCTATINGTKPDGNVYTYPCTVHSNFLTSAVYDQMTTVQGTHEAEIRISDGDSVVGTLNFQMAIEKAGVSEIDVSHTDVPTLLENIQASVDEAEYWAEQAAGAVAGVASFNGRHGSVLPIAGDYDSEKILLTSALHIGGEAQNNVQEALEAIINDGGAGHTILNGLGQEMPQRKNLRFAGANVSDDAENDTTNVTITGGSGGSKIIVTTSESSLHNKDVTISDGLTTATEQFSAGGVATFIGITMTGLLTITSTDGIDTATDTLNVPYYGNYTKAIAFFAFNATLNISTSASSLYGKTITIKKGSTTVGTTAFSAQGSASYTVHETGTYTCECEGYSGSATVSAETTYNVTINAGLALSAWITAGSTTDYPLNPSSYADFSALEADEAAVRQLMLVHDAVDYLAQATAGDSLMESVIGSDVCAKWINLSDYALDTLSANSDIASEMSTADKYGYGEWVKLSDNPETWGAKGNVPIMTANNAPYGVASNYEAFNGNGQSVTAAITDCSYQSVEPICVKKFAVAIDRACTVTLQGSNDGSTWVNIGKAQTYSNVGSLINYKVNGSAFYMRHRVHLSTASQIGVIQFYGRELTVKQASAPTDGREYIHIGSDYYTEDWGEKEFAQGSTRKTIYDHGVEANGVVSIENATKLNDCIRITSANGYCSQVIDTTSYTYMGGKAGLHASGTNRLLCGSATSNFTSANMPDSNGMDITNVNGSNTVAVIQAAGGTFDVKEVWIE